MIRMTFARWAPFLALCASAAIAFAALSQDVGEAAVVRRNGPILFLRGAERILWRMSPSGDNVRRVSDRAEGTLHCARGTRDGTRLTFSGYKRAPDTDGFKDKDIFVMRRNGTRVRRLTDDPADDGAPDWSPSGKRVVFTRGTEGVHELFLMRADGSRQRQLTDFGAFSYTPSWSPDRSRIAFTLRRNGLYNIFTIDLTGERWRRVTNAGRYGGWFLDPAWSPDGRKIAYRRYKEGKRGIYVMARDGTNKRRLTRGNDGSPSWSPDGKWIVFDRLVENKAQIFKMTASGERIRRLSNGKHHDFCAEWLSRR